MTTLDAVGNRTQVVGLHVGHRRLAARGARRRHVPLVYGLDLIAAIDGSDDPTYFSYDGLGSTSDLTDENADVIASWSYDVFGAVRASTGSSDQVFKFTGEQDPDTGLYFLRARYLDPESGRLISRDAMQLDQRYAYAGNNPVAFSDATSLDTGSTADWEPVRRRCRSTFAIVGATPNQDLDGHSAGESSSVVPGVGAASVAGGYGGGWAWTAYESRPPAATAVRFEPRGWLHNRGAGEQAGEQLVGRGFR